MKSRSQKPEWQQRIARERIDILFSLVEKEFRKNKERAKRYVELARKIGLRYNIRFSREMKNKFCKNCNSLLIHGFSSSVRLDAKSKSLMVKCLNCNRIYRQPWSKIK